MGSAWPKPIRSPKNAPREATAKHESADSGATFKAKPGRILAAGFRPPEWDRCRNHFWSIAEASGALIMLKFSPPLDAFLANYCGFALPRKYMYVNEGCLCSQQRAALPGSAFPLWLPTKSPSCACFALLWRSFGSFLQSTIDLYPFSFDQHVKQLSDANFPPKWGSDSGP